MENNLLEHRKKSQAKNTFKTRQKIKDKIGFYNLYAVGEFSVSIEIHEKQPVSSTVLPIVYEGRGGKRIWSPQTTATQDAWKIPCSGMLVRGGSALKRTTISVPRNTSYTTNRGGLKFQGRERQLLIPFRKNRAWKKQLMLKHEVHSAGRSSMCRKGWNAFTAAQHTTAGRAGKSKQHCIYGENTQR